MNEITLSPGISVVVCCHNSADVIGPTIRALAKQAAPAGCGFEVILVENRCCDDTVQRAVSAWGSIPYPLLIVHENKPGLIFARKAGVKNARFGILLFVDDDNILESDWVLKLCSLFDKMPSVGMIGGYNQALVQGETPEWFERYQSVYACGPRAESSTINPKKKFGAGLAFRTELLRSVLFSSLPLFLVGRTGTRLSRGEDTEMVYRCLLHRWDFYYDSSLRLKHFLLTSKLNWKYVCQARWGGGKAEVILRIYRDMIEGREPKTLSEYVASVEVEWHRFLAGLSRDRSKVNQEGDDVSLAFHRLQGMRTGLWMHRKDYDTIRDKLQRHFGRPAMMKEQTLSQ